MSERMPCGHGSWSVATSSEGTSYCQECERIGKLEAELEQLRASREVWATRAAEQEARAEQAEAILREFNG